jgi:hypothetical protein
LTTRRLPIPCPACRTVDDWHFPPCSKFTPKRRRKEPTEPSRVRPIQLTTSQHLDTAVAGVVDSQAHLDDLLEEGPNDPLEAELFIVQVLLAESRRKLEDLGRRGRGLA